MSTGFSRAQQGLFRPMVAKAWASVKEPGQGAVERREWYEDLLEAATGKRSSAECNAAEDFEGAMAAFEAVCGDSIFWQLRAQGGNARRLQYFCGYFKVEPGYLESIARRMFGVGLEELDLERRASVLAECKQQVLRQRNRGQAGDRPRRADEAKKGDFSQGKKRARPCGNSPF